MEEKRGSLGWRGVEGRTVLAPSRGWATHQAPLLHLSAGLMRPPSRGEHFTRGLAVPSTQGARCRPPPPGLLDFSATLAGGREQGLPVKVSSPSISAWRCGEGGCPALIHTSRASGLLYYSIFRCGNVMFSRLGAHRPLPLFGLSLS